MHSSLGPCCVAQTGEEALTLTPSVWQQPRSRAHTYCLDRWRRPVLSRARGQASIGEMGAGKGRNHTAGPRNHVPPIQLLPPCFPPSPPQSFFPLATQLCLDTHEVGYSCQRLTYMGDFHIQNRLFQENWREPNKQPGVHRCSRPWTHSKEPKQRPPLRLSLLLKIHSPLTLLQTVFDASHESPGTERKSWT